MCLPLCGVTTFLYISLILVFGCSRCKLVDCLVMSIVQLALMFGPIHYKFNSSAFLVTHVFYHLCTRFRTMQNFFYAFSEFFFFILLSWFSILVQSNVSFYNFAWEGRGGRGGGGMSGAISCCALTFYPFCLLSIYLFI